MIVFEKHYDVFSSLLDVFGTCIKRICDLRKRNHDAAFFVNYPSYLISEIQGNINTTLKII